MLMLVGPVGAGKTSLLKVLRQECGKAEKTQTICFHSDMIDTPGEYAQIPRFYSALTVTAVQADLILMVQDPTEAGVPLPPGFATMFPRPVLGVITKIDSTDCDLIRARHRLQQAGVKEPYFYVSAFAGTGITELVDHLSERGCR